MGKLRLGDITELAQRTKNLEAYDKELNQRILDNDLLIADNIRRIDEHGTRLDDHDVHLAKHDGEIADHERRLVAQLGRIENHEERITTMENTRVVKKMSYISEIPEIEINDLEPENY